MNAFHVSGFRKSYYLVLFYVREVCGIFGSWDLVLKWLANKNHSELVLACKKQQKLVVMEIAYLAKVHN